MGRRTAHVILFLRISPVTGHLYLSLRPSRTPLSSGSASVNLTSIRSFTFRGFPLMGQKTVLSWKVVYLMNYQYFKKYIILNTMMADDTWFFFFHLWCNIFRLSSFLPELNQSIACFTMVNMWGYISCPYVACFCGNFKTFDKSLEQSSSSNKFWAKEFTRPQIRPVNHVIPN